MPAASGLSPLSTEINFGNPSADTQTWFHYQTYPPPGYDYPREVIRAIRTQIDPLFVPLWVVTNFRTPAGSDLKFTHVCVAVGDWHLGDPIDPFEAHKYGSLEKLRARDYEMRAIRRGDDPIPAPPGRLLEILEGPLDKPWQRLPGEYVPLTMAKYHELRELGHEADELAKHWIINSQEDLQDVKAREFTKAKMDNMIAIKAKWKKESDYRWDHDWNHIMRQVEGLTVEEQKIILREKQSRGYIGHQLPFGVDYRNYLPK